MHCYALLLCIICFDDKYDAFGEWKMTRNVSQGCLLYLQRDE